MTTKIIFSGFGGQGILTLGQIIANIAMNQNKHVTWIPSYGAEMRGGTANCSVIISDKLIGSPIVKSNADILVAMNLPSVTKFLGLIKPGGIAFLNSGIITEKIERPDINIINIDASNIAAKLGNLKIANMVMAGGILKHTELFTAEEAKVALNQKFKTKNPDLVSLNLQALMSYGNLN